MLRRIHINRLRLNFLPKVKLKILLHNCYLHYKLEFLSYRLHKRLYIYINLPLPASRITINITDNSSLNLFIINSSIHKSSGCRNFSHFWIIWIILTWFKELCHSHTYNTNFSWHKIRLHKKLFNN